MKIRKKYILYIENVLTFVINYSLFNTCKVLAFTKLLGMKFHHIDTCGVKLLEIWIVLKEMTENVKYFFFNENRPDSRRIV